MTKTPEQIIKALEICTADTGCPLTCPYINELRCEGNIKKDALELIKEQQTEIERLNEYIGRCKRGEEYWVKCLLEAPEKSIRDFVQKLKRKRRTITSVGIAHRTEMRVVTISDIDSLAKEFCGNSDENI